MTETLAVAHDFVHTMHTMHTITNSDVVFKSGVQCEELQGHFIVDSVTWDNTPLHLAVPRIFRCQRCQYWTLPNTLHVIYMPFDAALPSDS